MGDGQTLRLSRETEASVRHARDLFECIRRALSGILPPRVLIEHVGATAVPGRLTKGDLDIAVRVGRDQFDSCTALLGARFDANPGSARTPAFAAFVDGSTDPPVGVQLVVIGSDLDVFTRFRDALRADPALVARYNELKCAWDGCDMEGYRSAKARFINEVLTKAVA
jgi:GrpB-like predicted nucleotidyltransferase (UPF0157 family)